MAATTFTWAIWVTVEESSSVEAYMVKVKVAPCARVSWIAIEEPFSVARLVDLLVMSYQGFEHSLERQVECHR